MGELFSWISDMRNSKILALLIFFIAFVLILLYVFTGKERGKRLESYKDIPFLDDDDEQKSSNTVKKDE